MAFCNKLTEGHPCPVPGQLEKLRDGLLEADLSEQGIENSKDKALCTKIAELAELLGSRGDFMCVGPDVDRDVVVFVSCQNPRARDIATVTESSFDIIVTSVQLDLE